MTDRKALMTFFRPAVCIGLSLLLLFTSTLLSSCRKGPSDPDGKPDKLGSWGQINQEIKRGSDWKQIVFDSPFQLGKKTLAGSKGPSESELFYYYFMEYGTYPSIDGSTVAVPMAVEFARQHLGLPDEDANSFVAFSTTHNAYVNLITKGSYGGWLKSQNASMEPGHPVDIIIATEPSDEELKLAKEQGITLVKKPVCYDAFVFITYKDNPVDSLTLDQIRGIYSGKITNWKQVGGNDIPIVAYQREKNSGSQTAMENMVMGNTRMLPPPTVPVAEFMNKLIDVVAEYRVDNASIGYTYRYYIDTLYKNQNIKILKINGVSSDVEHLRDGSYPLAVCYYGVIRGGEETSVGGKFLDWMLSPEGQRCIRQAGYTPYFDY